MMDISLGNLRMNIIYYFPTPAARLIKTGCVCEVVIGKSIGGWYEGMMQY